MSWSAQFNFDVNSGGGGKKSWLMWTAINAQYLIERVEHMSPVNDRRGIGWIWKYKNINTGDQSINNTDSNLFHVTV